MMQPEKLQGSQVQVYVLAMMKAQWQLHAHMLALVWMQGQMPLQAQKGHCLLVVTCRTQEVSHISDGEVHLQCYHCLYAL